MNNICLGIAIPTYSRSKDVLEGEESREAKRKWNVQTNTFSVRSLQSVVGRGVGPLNLGGPRR